MGQGFESLFCEKFELIFGFNEGYSDGGAIGSRSISLKTKDLRQKKKLYRFVFLLRIWSRSQSVV